MGLYLEEVGKFMKNAIIEGQRNALSSRGSKRTASCGRTGSAALKPEMPWYGYSPGHWDEEDEENAEWAAAGDYEKVAARLQQKGTKI
jgi:hypothetical protein